MTLSHGFRQLATVLEEIEANGLEVLDVATTDGDGTGRLVADLTVSVPLDGRSPVTESDRTDTETGETATDQAATTGPTESTTDRRSQVLDPRPVETDATNGASVSEPPDEDDDGNAAGERVDETTTRATDSPVGGDSATDAGVVRCPIDDCEATFESDHGMKIHRTKVHRHESESGGDATPAYRDPERLREVYEECDSFNEMREALETDVSAQTVRRQMIAHDIYEPGDATAPPTGGDDDASSEDGDADEPKETTSDSDDEAAVEDRTELEAIELPEGVTVADLKAAVSAAKTLYDVQQRFDLDREEAMELLDRYDLLEVVHGRVSDRDRRKDVDEDEITRRILEHAPATPTSEA